MITVVHQTAGGVPIHGGVDELEGVETIDPVLIAFEDSLLSIPS
jgi:hypothetical protein